MNPEIERAFIEHETDEVYRLKPDGPGLVYEMASYEMDIDRHEDTEHPIVQSPSAFTHTEFVPQEATVN